MSGNTSGTSPARVKRVFEVCALSASALLVDCNRKKSAQTIQVSAAVSLRAPLEQLAQQYSRLHPEVSVQFVFGASGDLATQIAHGANVDLFASASTEHVQRLQRTVSTEEKCTLATNQLVLIRKGAAELANLQWDNLATHPAVQHLGLGIAASVPVGRYAEQVLDRLAIRAALESKIVRAANAHALLELVARDEADAAIVYLSDTANRTDFVVVGPPPTSAQASVQYPLVRVLSQDRTAGRHHRDVNAFAQWICSTEAEAVFVRNGFGRR